MGHAGVRLRVIEGGVESPVVASPVPSVANARPEDRVPVPRTGLASARVAVAVVLSLAVHVGIIAWGMHWRAEQETRAEGGSAATEVVEGVSVILLDSLPSQAVPETLPQATAVADVPLATTETAEARPATDDAPAVAPVETPAVEAAPLPDVPPGTEGDVAASPVTDDERRSVPEEPRSAAAVVDQAKPVRPEPPPEPKAKPAEKVVKPVPPAPARPASVAEDAAKGPQPGEAGAGGTSREERGRADLSSYQARLAAHLRRYRTYPPEARAGGTARVAFTVDAAGRVIDVRLAGSSGHAALDEAAVAMVRRASPFPAIPPSLGLPRLAITVPVRFGTR